LARIIAAATPGYQVRGELRVQMRWNEACASWVIVSLFLFLSSRTFSLVLRTLVILFAGCICRVDSSHDHPGVRKTGTRLPSWSRHYFPAASGYVGLLRSETNTFHTTGVHHTSKAPSSYHRIDIGVPPQRRYETIDMHSRGGASRKDYSSTNLDTRRFS
jgi:hypothetical protein